MEVARKLSPDGVWEEGAQFTASIGVPPLPLGSPRASVVAKVEGVAFFCSKPQIVSFLFNAYAEEFAVFDRCLASKVHSAN